MTTVSMEELARAFRVKRKTNTNAPKPLKCNKCGGNMVGHPMTNIYTCTGTTEVEIDGKKALVPCKNFLIRNYLIK